MSARRQPGGVNAELPTGISYRRTAAGRDRYDARWVDANGVERSGTRATLAKAVALREEQRAKVANGGVGDPSGAKTLLADWRVVYWQARARNPRVRASTLTRERLAWKSQILPYLGHRKLSDLRPIRLNTWMSDLLDRGLAPSTINQTLQILAKSLDAAIAEGLIETNNARLVEKLDEDREEKQPIPAGLAVAIEKEIDEWWAPVVPALKDTGLRIGELAALDVGHLSVIVAGIGGAEVWIDPLQAHGMVILGGGVEVQRSVSYAHKELSRAASYMTVGDTKTRSGRRSVQTITARTAVLLVDMIYERYQRLDDPLFIGPRGARLDPHNFRERVWRPTVEKVAPGQGLKPHELRHLAVSVWLATDESKFKIARRAGHKNTTTLESVYGHALGDDQSQARATMERAHERGVNESRGTKSNVVEMPRGHAEAQ